MNQAPPPVDDRPRVSRFNPVYIVVAVVVLALGGAGIYKYVQVQQARDSWEHAASDSIAGLHRCLIGANLADGESADERIRAIALLNPPSAEGWPGRCRPIAARLYDLAISGEDERLLPHEELLFQLKTMREAPEVGSLFEHLLAFDLPPARPSNDPEAPAPTRTAGADSFVRLLADSGRRVEVQPHPPAEGPVNALFHGRTRHICTFESAGPRPSARCRRLSGEIDSAEVALLGSDPGGTLLVHRSDPDNRRSAGIFRVREDGGGERVDPEFDAASARTAYGRADGEIVWIGRIDAERYLYRRLRGEEVLEELPVIVARATWPGPFTAGPRFVWVQDGRRSRRRRRSRPRLMMAELPAEALPEEVEGEAPATEPPAEPAEEGGDPWPPGVAFSDVSRLSEVPRDAVVETSCQSVDTFAVVFHEMGQYERWVAFRDPSGWAPIARVRIGRPHLTCGLGEVQLTRADDGRLTIVECDSDGCEVNEHELAELHLGSGPIDGVPMGRQALIVFGSTQGGLRIRHGRAEALGDAEDRVLVDDAEHGGFDVEEVHMIPRADHAIVLVRDGSGDVRALRIDDAGQVQAIVPSGR